jgi:MFS family permease
LQTVNDNSSGVISNGKVTIWSRAFIALLLVNFLRMLGQSISNTIVPLFAYDLGAVASMVGFVSGSFAITAMAIRPFAGPAFDSFSKTRLFLLFGVILTVASFGYSLANTIPMIIVMRLIHGIGAGCTGSLGMALASEVLPIEKMNSGISIYSISQSAALAIGPAFAVWAADAWGYNTTFILTGIIMAACCVVAGLFVQVKEPASKPPYQLKLSRAFSKRAIIMSVILMLMMTAFSCTNSFLVIYGNLRGVDQIGLFFTVNAICLIGTRPLFGNISDKYGASKVIIPTMVLFAVSFVVISQATTLAAFIVAALVAACGFGAASPLVQALVFKCVPLSQRGSASNTSFLGMDAGNLIGPYLGGLVIEGLRPALGSEVAAYSGMWMVMLAPIFLGLIIFVANRSRIRRYVAEADAENAKVEAK